MPKTIAVDFTANEQIPERALRNATRKVNEYLESHPGSRLISTSHSITGRFGAMSEKQEGGTIQAQIVAIFELPT